LVNVISKGYAMFTVLHACMINCNQDI